MTTAVHITHEAIQKFGGIGTVLHGLITSTNYWKYFNNTLLYSPLFHRDGVIEARLGENSKLIYSGLDHFGNKKWSDRFRPIEERYKIKIAYGKKSFKAADRKIFTVDIVVSDIWEMPDNTVNAFKYKLWENFALQSDHFQHDRDYEQYLRIGIAIRDIFEALYGEDERVILFSHEYMGMCSALALEIDKKTGRRKGDTTIFYAHEVSTARIVVENHPGHDLSFYNILNIDRDSGISLEETFGSYAHHSRSELVKRAHFLDYIFAVSDITKEELVYLSPQTDTEKIKVVYNGIPIEKSSFEEKEKSMEVIKKYCDSLLNFKPDYIFTHVARLINSKALWRDISLLYHLDEHFSKNRVKGFFIILSTLVGNGRSPADIRKMEAEYGWPVIHKEGWPDLVGIEVDLYKHLELFNAKSRAIKGVFLNQFGFSRERCGERMPKEASILDLRLASDIEFGLSIYEPFGIAQLETLPYGGIPLISSSCGSSQLIRKNLDDRDYLIIDFTEVPDSFRELLKSKHDFLSVNQGMRNQVESELCRKAAPRLIKILPKNNSERKARFKRLSKESEQFSWEHVTQRIISHLNFST